MHKKAVIIFGPPGSGKSTQADLIADKLHLIHFDTGHFLEGVVYDPKRHNSPEIRRERKFFESGKLMTPSFVFREIKNAIQKYAKAGWGIVLSGSPRTLAEAKKLGPILLKLYGKENVYVIDLRIKPEVSIYRNSKRLICSVCAAPLLTSFYPSKNPKHCPRCGAPLYKRKVDKPQVIKMRLVEYVKRTEPLLGYFREHSYNLHILNGALPPYKVLHEVLSIAKKKSQK